MNHYDLKKEFDKIERLIAINKANGNNIEGLLKTKIKLLKISYTNLSKSIESGALKKIAPMYAKELAFLNNIKNLQEEINDSTQETVEEIAKVHQDMRENNLGWILDNLPEPTEE